MSPVGEDGGKVADGPLKQALERDFVSVEEFKAKFNATTAAIQGSGWGWLVSVVSHVVLGWTCADVWFRRDTIQRPRSSRSSRLRTRIR